MLLVSPCIGRPNDREEVKVCNNLVHGAKSLQ